MTNAEKVHRVAILTGETDDAVMSAYLDLAKSKILQRAYPFGTTITDVPSRYEDLQIEIAIYLLNKRGAEGETAHNESGVNRSYESASVPDSMLKAVTPNCTYVG